MLKDEILEVLDLFEKFQISDEKQREIFKNGLYFDYAYGDPSPKNQHLNFFGVGILLKTCLENNIEIDVNQLIDTPYMFGNEELIKKIALLQDSKDETQKDSKKKLVLIEDIGKNY